MAFKSMHVVCPRARRDSAALPALCPSICLFRHLCHGDCSPAVGFQSGLIFNINSLPLLLILEAFPNSCHLLTAALGLHRFLPSATAKPYNRAAEGKTEDRTFQEVPFKSVSTETSRRKFFLRRFKKSSVLSS